jgi:hypothetical protein
MEKREKREREKKERRKEGRKKIFFVRSECHYVA